MKNAQPIFDSATHYRIELQGHVSAGWLQSFDSSADTNLDETRQVEDVSVRDLRTDQAGIVGLVRRLHGLGTTILNFQVIT